MFVIGLTGPTGSGKSAFAAMLRESGFCVADADAAARQVVQAPSPVLDALCEAFGADILESDGTLCRSRLAKRAFSSPENVRKLNALTHAGAAGRRVLSRKSGRGAARVRALRSRDRT